MKQIASLLLAILLCSFSAIANAENAAINGYQTISAGNAITVAVKDDGSVLYAGQLDPQLSGAGACAYWTDIVSVAAGQVFVAGLRSDGTTVITKYIDAFAGFMAKGTDYEGWDGQELDAVNTWTDIVAISAGPNHVVGLRKDGTVIAAGSNTKGCCDVSNWNDIVAVSAGHTHTVGLRKDGTVIAVGDNEYGKCDVSGWKDIIEVSAGGYYTIGLDSEGKVLYAGSTWQDGAFAPQLESWDDIVAISAGFVHVVGLRKDGTVISTSPIPAPPFDCGQNHVESWKNIVAISAGNGHTIGLKADGTLVAVGEEIACNVKSWANIRTE